MPTPTRAKPKTSPKDRPKTSRSALAQFIGQDSVQSYLGAVLSQNQVSHTYLFLGPQGVGKFPAAQAFAQALLCPQKGCGRCEACEAALAGTHPDLLSLNGKLGVDDARELITWAEAAPVEARHRVILLNLDELTTIAQNALLKTLESPSPGTVFILRATPASPVLSTIRSRSVILNFHPLSVQENTQILLTQGYSEDESVAAALESGGSYEIAENILKRGRAQSDFARWAASIFKRPGSLTAKQALSVIAAESTAPVKEEKTKPKAKGKKKIESEEPEEEPETGVSQQQAALAVCSRLAYYYSHWLGKLTQQSRDQDDFYGTTISQEQLLGALQALQDLILALRVTTNQELAWSSFSARVRALL